MVVPNEMVKLITFLYFLQLLLMDIKKGTFILINVITNHKCTIFFLCDLNIQVDENYRDLTKCIVVIELKFCANLLIHYINALATMDVIIMVNIEDRLKTRLPEDEQ